MREILGVTQDSPLAKRRWFHHDYFDLFVSQAKSGALYGFELCYGSDGADRALVWDRERGYFHDGTGLLAGDDLLHRPGAEPAQDQEAVGDLLVSEAEAVDE